jgi:hypothetical protein
MVAVKSMPMGPPMGGQMGPPPGSPTQMPNTGGPPPMMQPGMAPPPMGMAPPPMVGVPQAAQASAPLSTQVSGYGGSASGRAKFKGALGARKNAFLAKQKPLAPPPVAPASFGQFAGGPMAGAPMGPPMGPVPPMGPPNTMMAGVGRMIGNNANVGSAPVQLMNGGVVPLFGGLGQY